MSNLIPYPSVPTFGYPASVPTGFSKSYIPSQVGSARGSLGGQPARLGLEPMAMNPLVRSLDPIGERTNVFRFFPNLIPAEATDGKTDYFALFLGEQSGLLTGGTVQIGQPGQGTVSLWLPGGGIVQRVASELTAPSGASWNTASTPQAFTFTSQVSTQGVVIPQVAPIWFKRVFAPGVTASAYDFMSLFILTNDGTYTTFIFSWSINSGVYLIETSNPQDPIGMSGDTFTFTVTKSDGTSVDPPSNLLFVEESRSFPQPRTRDGGDPTGAPGRMAGTSVEQAVRTGTGVYTWDFKPQQPGYRYVTLDAGGEYSTGFDVQVAVVTAV